MSRVANKAHLRESHLVAKLRSALAGNDDDETGEAPLWRAPCKVHGSQINYVCA